MGGFNTTEFNEIINYLPIFIMAIGSLVSLFMAYQAIVRFLWASKLGGINSMGTKSFTSEAVGYLIGALVVGNVVWVITSITGDLISAPEFSWEPLTNEVNSMQYAGKLIVNISSIFGIVLVMRGGMSIPKISQGQATITEVIWLILIGVLATQLIWVNQQIANLTPFNPMGFLLPETGSIINI
jgi:hypothetical protein